ncbi:hypothetical protein F5X68DRAFT_226283 [Plectosphaerella plurivora]|uniref:Uncharacterized protein n=1 Tax=Plectosphaerella plurivora TaxID=936078 RepID=A0A9P8VNS8_9PEZI|nr:hypothetical protein F5X68DRAFT_226283 [Plectosphaerella plurivora]
MRFHLAAVLATLVVTCAAANDAKLVANEYCSFIFFCNRKSAKFHYDGKTYDLNASNGCSYPRHIPGVYEICVDWLADRGHFKVHGEPLHCIDHSKTDIKGCGDFCNVHTFDEQPCRRGNS